MGNEGNGVGKVAGLYWGAESDALSWHLWLMVMAMLNTCNKTPSQTFCVYILPATLEDLVFCFTNISALLTQCHKLIWGGVLENSLLTPLGKVAEEKYLAFSLLWVLHVISSGGMCKCIKWLTGISWAINGPRIQGWALAVVLLHCSEFCFPVSTLHEDYSWNPKATETTRETQLHEWSIYLSLTHTLFMRWNKDLIFRKF